MQGIAKRITDAERLERILKVFPDEQEAKDILEYDKKVEREETTEFDLSPAKLKIAQQFTRTGTRKPTVWDWKKRERKPNATKEGLVSELYSYLFNYGEFLTEKLHIAEKSGKVCFKIDGKWYTWSLTEHRTLPKWIKEE